MPRKVRATKRGIGLENPRAARLDTLPAEAVVELLLDEESTAVNAVRLVTANIANISQVLANRLATNARLVYVGEGTAGRIAAFEAAECGPYFGLPPSLITSILAGGPHALARPLASTMDERREAEQRLRKVAIGPGDVLCIVADRPLTPFLLSAIDYARFRQSLVLLVAAVALEESVRAKADHVITLDPGPEVVLHARRHKAATALKLCLSAMNTATFVQLGKTYGGLMVDIRTTTPSTWEYAINMVSQLSGLGELAAKNLLKKAGGRAKIALVMHYTKVSATRAKELLIQHRGALRAIVGDKDLSG
jgi:N-acetylmuramic acid 6-phosphate etherase